MSLHPIEGHEQARAALANATREGKLPGSLLVYGPSGIGRQRLALWLAQLQLCEQPGVEPCGTCIGCRLVGRLEHPDLHWFFPLVRPRGAGSGEKLIEALEAARAEEIEARRTEPLYPPAVGEGVGLYLAQIQAIRRLASTRPAMARRQVFIIADAELLVPQESSPEAANALLKLLEEPPDGTIIVVTARDPDTLLPTIRSRLLPVRLAPLPVDRVARFLTEHRGVDPAQAAAVARLSQGSIGAALGFLPTDGEPGPLEAVRQDAKAMLFAAADVRAAGRLQAAHGTGVSGARGGFRDSLDMLELWCRDLAAVASGAETLVVNADAIEELRALVGRLPAAAGGAAEAIDRIEEAKALTVNNVNPQLTVAWLLRRVGAALRGRPGDIAPLIAAPDRGAGRRKLTELLEAQRD